MTEKRFKRFHIADGFKIVAIKDNDKIMNSNQVCEKLNELHEENIKIKKNCNRTHKENAELIDCISDLGYSVIIRNGKVVLER